MATSTFARFRDLHLPAFLLNEQMRVPAGMIHLSNDIIYKGKLKDGKGTGLDENPEAQALKNYFRDMYPSIKPEPQHLIYPVMLNVYGESTIERNGKSVCNAYHVATTIGEIIKLIQTHEHANSCDIGIATPYRAQIRLYRRALLKANSKFPDLKHFDMSISLFRLGTAEYWQGKELAYVFVDLVRASNDAANLGFVSNARRLNVLITRQTLGLCMIADERCILTLAQQAERDALEEDQQPVHRKKTDAQHDKKSTEDRKNATVIEVFKWMRDKGRVVNVAPESLVEDFVDFPKPEPEVDTNAGWGDDTDTKATGEIEDAETAAPAITQKNPVFTTAYIEQELSSSAPDPFDNDTTLVAGGEDVISGSAGGDADDDAGLYDDDDDDDDEIAGEDGSEEGDEEQGGAWVAAPNDFAPEAGW